MELKGKKLGILLAADPDSANFTHALNLADTALTSGVAVYLYLLDRGIEGLRHAELGRLRDRGLNLFACALGGKRRNLPAGPEATWVGLATASDLIADTDRFLSFT